MNNIRKLTNRTNKSTVLLAAGLLLSFLSTQALANVQTIELLKAESIDLIEIQHQAIQEVNASLTHEINTFSAVSNASILFAEQNSLKVDAKALLLEQAKLWEEDNRYFSLLSSRRAD